MKSETSIDSRVGDQLRAVTPQRSTDHERGDEESDNTKDVVAELLRLALLSGGKPIKRTQIRDIVGADRQKQQTCLSQVTAILRETYGFDIVNLGAKSVAAHGSQTRDEYLLVSRKWDDPEMVTKDRKKRRVIAEFTPQTYMDMMSVLHLALGFLVIERDGMTEEDMMDNLFSTQLFGSDFDDASALIQPHLDCLVAQRYLDLTKLPAPQNTKAYVIGPAAVACVTRDSLLTIFVRLIYPSYKGSDATPEQEQSIEILQKLLNNSIFPQD